MSASMLLYPITLKILSHSSSGTIPQHGLPSRRAIMQRWSNTSARDDGENEELLPLSKKSRPPCYSTKQLFDHPENMLLALITDEQSERKS